MLIRIWTGVIILYCLLNCSFGENILFMHIFASYSHIVSSMPLAEALTQKGHNVTYISAIPFPSHNPKIKFIVPEALKNFITAVIDQTMDISNRLEGRLPNWITSTYQLNIAMCEVTIGNEEFQNWLKLQPKVDLIYWDNFSGPECGLAIARKLKAKLAIFNTVVINPELFDALGVPAEASSVPTIASNAKTPMTGFFPRAINSLGILAMRFLKSYHWPELETVIKTHLNISDLPSFNELYKDISLVMTNTQAMDEYRRSLPPMFVNVPGLHVRESHHPLPNNITKFLNGTGENGQPSEGFIYISLGTVVKAPKLPPYTLEIFFNSMKAFPNIRFLWRWDGDFPTDGPKNLFLSTWFNQQDLLAHPKALGFVTQAGRPSYLEAISNAVPLITFPILGDQDYNADILHEMGVSISLEIVDVTEEKLKDAFRKLVYDKKFRSRCFEVSKLYKDLPMKPIDTAVWYTEYVLRHKNTDHLKPLAMTYNQTWYQTRLLDVYGFLAMACVIFAFLIYYVTTCIVNLVLKTSSPKKLKQK